MAAKTKNFFRHMQEVNIKTKIKTVPFLNFKRWVEGEGLFMSSMGQVNHLSR